MNKLGQALEWMQGLQKAFGIIRLVSPEERKLIGEELFQDSQVYPSFQYALHADLYVRCLKEDRAVISIVHENANAYLYVFTPAGTGEKPLVWEYVMDVTRRVYMGGDGGCGESDFTCYLNEMSRLVITDDLTRLYNRRYIAQRLQRDLQVCRGQGTALSLIFCDLDNFKEVNDLYGHFTGDMVLRETADEIIRGIRSGCDWAARYGGDEFLICLCRAGYETAFEIADRIRNALGNRRFCAGNTNISQTASFGVYTLEKVPDDVSVDDLIGLADKNTYLAKLRGGNRVM